MINKVRRREKPLALIVDDDLSMRLSMSAALAKEGFEVKEAENGRVGVESFKAERPDLILLDVVMPEMDGFETCSRIRKLPGGEYVQILMVTGLDDTESTEKAFKVGANGFIAKPINWVMLGHRGKYMLRAGRAFQELERSKSRLAKTQKLAKLGNWEIDLASHEFHCSLEARKLLGIRSDKSFITYDDFFKTIGKTEREEVRTKIDSALNAKKSFRINYKVVHPNGSICHILNQGEILFNEQGAPEVLLGAVQDVTQLKLAEEEIRLLAFYDGLTGLANRLLFHDKLEQEIGLAKRNKQKFALLYLDLDQFKRVNDTFGHHIGDLLLQKISTVLQKCIRSTDVASRISNTTMESMIARLGGDEFTLILSDIHEPENAAIVARRILQEIPKPYVLGGIEISVTTSIGISLFPEDGNEANALLKNADTAMYQAKNKGRNNYQFYKKSLNVAALERFTLEQSLSKAIKNDDFTLYFQPKINVKDRRIIGAEALIRWIHPQKGMIPPDQFISIAEESGQIVKINQWVIRHACNTWRTWQHQGLHPGNIAVNLSGYQFTEHNILDTLDAALEESQLDPAQLEIEITENILMQDTEETKKILQQLKDRKVLIALDDFGTGYSSLSYLTSFKVDSIKIDRSFVIGCLRKPENLVIIKAITAMGHSLGLKIIAEGVETASQFELIKEVGIDEAQGYHFAPPLPFNEFGELVRKKHL